MFNIQQDEGRACRRVQAGEDFGVTGRLELSLEGGRDHLSLTTTAPRAGVSSQVKSGLWARTATMKVGKAV